MNISDIHKSFRGHLKNNWTDTPVAWINREFDEQLHDEWIRMRITNRIGTTSEEAGSNPAMLRVGGLIFDIYVKRLTGTARSLELANKLEDLFTFYEDGDLYVPGPNTDPKGVEYTKLYRTQVTFMWEILFCKT